MYSSSPNCSMDFSRTSASDCSFLARHAKTARLMAMFPSGPAPTGPTSQSTIQVFVNVSSGVTLQMRLATAEMIGSRDEDSEILGLLKKVDVR